MKSRILCIILFITNLSFGQAVLFVNDNGINPANTDTLLSALNTLNMPYDIFDARDSMRSPDYPEIMNYNLIIWYCSSDGVGNYFWEGNDVDNFALIQWLNDGGMLWVIGTDILYDRYTTPTQFSTGDFVYDYLGIEEYHAQSYGDDGGTGVAQLDPVNPEIDFLPLHWSFSTAWWVDALVPVSTSIPVYKMGPEGYIFDNYLSGLAKYRGLPFPYITLTYAFDPAIIDNKENRIALIANSFDLLLLVMEVKENLEPGKSVIYPNPATDKVRWQLASFRDFHEEIILQLIDIQGLILYEEQKVCNNSMVWDLDLRDYSPGMYYLRAISSTACLSQRLIKAGN
ncbi:MAG: T9SS type A sorting domain-containing protein [Bacteroidales bacterium]